MMMIMPMIVNPDGTFDHKSCQQCISMPMTSMANAQFNDMMMTAGGTAAMPPSHAKSKRASSPETTTLHDDKAQEEENEGKLKAKLTPSLVTEQ
jgi:hypothetical protein